MAGNSNTQPRALGRTATRFTSMMIGPRKNKGDANTYGQYPATVVLTLKAALNQTAKIIDIQDTNGVSLTSFGPTGAPTFAGGLASASIGLGGLGVAHALYSFAVDGGAIGLITPVSTATIPANAIILGATVNSTTAVTSAGSATVSVGTSAGSSATSILAATAKASLSLDAILNGVPTFAVPVKMSAAGAVTVTVAAAALTGGVIEVFVYYVVAAGA